MPALSHRDALLGATRNFLNDTATTELERVTALLDVAREFYDFSKFQAPAGEGLDGRDGPERRAIGDAINAIEDHLHTLRTRDLQ